METMVSRDLSLHQAHELLLKLEAAGLNPKLAQRIIDSQGNNLAGMVVRLILVSSFGPITSRECAREIMGQNFFGIEDWITLYGANLSQKQLRQVAEFPWGEDVLASTCPLCSKTVKDCHFAFLGLDRLNGKPLTILKLEELHRGDPNSWYSREKFATRTTMSLRWYLLHKSIVPDSKFKTFGEQKAMLPPEYEVPSAITEVTKNLLAFRKTGVYADPPKDGQDTEYGRCTDIMDGDRVCVGTLSARGQYIDHFGGDHEGDDSEFHVGVAASRLPTVAQ